MTDRIRILVAEDQQRVRDGIVTMLGVRDDFVVVAQVGDGERAVAEAHRTRPDVAMLDIRMPVLDGIEATRRIAEELPETRVQVLTTFGSDELVFEALAAGAAGFLLKDVRAEDLLEAVAAVARGEGRLDPKGPQQRGDRHRARCRSRHREHPRGDGARQAGRARPGAGGDRGVRVGARPALTPPEPARG